MNATWTEWENGEEDTSAEGLLHQGADSAAHPHRGRDLQLRQASVPGGQHAGAHCPVLSVAALSFFPTQGRACGSP